MSEWPDPLDQLRRIEISAADLDRWEAVAESAEYMAPGLLLEIFRLRADPTKRNLRAAANAARYAASFVDEPLKTEAVALAEELERRSA